MAFGRITAAASPHRNTRAALRPHLRLPVESLDCHDSLLPGEPGYERKQSWPEAVVVDNVIAGEGRVNGAEKSMNRGIEVFGANGRKPKHAHALVLGDQRRKVSAAVDCDRVSQTG